jgi:hypothetical protein
VIGSATPRTPGTIRGSLFTAMPFSAIHAMTLATAARHRPRVEDVTTYELGRSSLVRHDQRVGAGPRVMSCTATPQLLPSLRLTTGSKH